MKFKRILAALLALMLLSSALATEIEATPTPEIIPTVEASPTIAPTPTAEATPPAVENAKPSAEHSPEPSPSPSEPPEPLAISIPEELVIGLKERVNGAVKPEFSDGREYKVQYSSSNSKVASVNAKSGSVYGAKTGTATITVSIEGGPSASCEVTVRKAPSKLTLKADRTTLGVGESTEFSLSFGKNAHSHALKLSSSNESVVRIEGSRLVACGAGSAKISAEAFNGKKASLKIKVLPAPESVSFAHEAPLLGVGQSFTLEAAVNDGAAGGVEYAIVSGNEFVELEGDTLHAVAPGEAVIRASGYNGVYADIAAAIVAAPTGLTLSSSSVTLGLKQKLTKPVEIQQDGGVQGGLRYESSKPSVVSVNAKTGSIYGVKTGSATITVRAYNGVSASYDVTVLRAPSKISLSLRTKLGVGESITPEVSAASSKEGLGSYTLKSGNKDVLSVDGESIFALSPGKAKLTAKSYNGKTASKTITVYPAPESVSFTHESPSLGAGERFTLKAEVNKGSAGAIEYSIVSGDSVVLEGDTLTAVSSGEAVVRASAYNGVYEDIAVRVLPPAEELIPDADSITIAVGKREALGFSALPADCRDSYSFASSDARILRVDKSGVISGMARGEAVVTIFAAGGASVEVPVKVVGYGELHAPFSMAHRGASGYYPENTLAAFIHAADYGADMVELDVRKTKDSKLVIFHNSTMVINGKSRKISQLTLKQIQKANPDVPSFDEAMACIAQTGLDAMVEIKSSGIEKAVVKIVKANGMENRVVYGSFTLSVINKLRGLHSGCDTVYIVNQPEVLNKVLKKTGSYSAGYISLRQDLLTEEVVRDLHLDGRKVVAWTINTAKDVKRARDMGVDGITTDYPDLV